MKFIDFIQILLRNKRWLLLFPFSAALLVFYLTRDIPRSYSSEMVIYTGIASGYNLDNDINGKIDYHAANSKFDNLINTITSKETRKEASLRLLASFIVNRAELRRIVSALQLEIFPALNDSVLLKKVTGRDQESTYYLLVSEVKKGADNPYYVLLNGEKENPFHVGTLGKITATRIGFSDMVRVEYTSYDPYLTKATLDKISEVFLTRYKRMKIGEVNSVVNYFEEQTHLAYRQLQEAELRLKDFRTLHNVINYYEQTKYISDQKEDFEQQRSGLLMRLQGHEAALKKVEQKMDSRILLQLKSRELMEVRDQLSSAIRQRATSQIRGTEGNDSGPQLEQLRNRMEANLEDYYQLNNSTEGIPGKELLSQWLELTVNVEDHRAQLASLGENFRAFEQSYAHFAPMGSDLNKLERDVEVNEKEYLSLLHNLNQSKLHERNLVVTENLSITDPPGLPVVANSSRRSLLVLATFFCSILFVIGFLLLKEYLDESISHPLRLREHLEMDTATIFAEKVNPRELDRAALDQRSYQRWKQFLEARLATANNLPVRIRLIPLHSDCLDSTSLCSGIIRELQQRTAQETEGRCQLHYTEEVLGQSPLPSSCDCDQVILLANAASRIEAYQSLALTDLRHNGIPVQAILFHVRLYHFEKYMGEIPKKRSALRKRIKELTIRYT